MDVRNPAGTGWKQNGASKTTFGSSHMHNFPAQIFNHGIMVIQLPIHADSSWHSAQVATNHQLKTGESNLHQTNSFYQRVHRSVREHFSGRLRWTWFDAQHICHSWKPNIASRPWFVRLVVCLLGFCWGFLKPSTIKHVFIRTRVVSCLEVWDEVLDLSTVDLFMLVIICD